MRIFLIGGARPNFMKLAPISRAFDKYGLEYDIVHTGQHYDYEMNEVFFEQFELKEPAYYLQVGSGTHAEQTGQIMLNLERLCMSDRPGLIFVVGDVNSTMAAALVASKLQIKLAHQEAGARSFDRRMPEEVNRVVTDVLSDYLFCRCSQDSSNLLNEGINRDKIYLPGDVMVDNLLYYKSKLPDEEVEPYCLVTIHRASNTDNVNTLKEILKGISDISEVCEVIFPVHPRTMKAINDNDIGHLLKPNVFLIEPVGYFEFLRFMANAKVVVTDSGGIQTETSILNIPCVTVRENTETDYTISQGTNMLVGKDITAKKIFELATYPLFNEFKKSNFIPSIKKLLDGKASERISKVIYNENINFRFST